MSTHYFRANDLLILHMTGNLYFMESKIKNSLNKLEFKLLNSVKSVLSVLVWWKENCYTEALQ